MHGASRRRMCSGARLVRSHFGRMPPGPFGHSVLLSCGRHRRMEHRAGGASGAPVIIGEARATEGGQVETEATPRSIGRGDVAMPASHQGRLFLDRVSQSSWQLTDMTSLETAALQGDLFELVFDDHGRAAVAGVRDAGADSEPTVQLVEELMQFDVWVGGNGETYIGRTTESQTNLTSLRAFGRKHFVVDIRLRLGSSTATSLLTAFIFRRPRGCGAKVFWGCFDLYDAFGMTGYKGLRSKWCFACLPSWQRQASGHFTGELFVASKHANNRPGPFATEQGGPTSTHLLPQTAAATVAMLNMVCRWAFATADRGGLKADGPRSAATTAFQCFLQLAVAHGSFQIQVVCDDAWRGQWPRPSAKFGDTTCAMVVTAEGDLKYEALSSLSGDLSKCAVARRWHRALFGPMVTSMPKPSEPLSDFFARTVRVAPLSSLVAQVLFIVARRVEALVCSRGQKADKIPMDFEYREHKIKVGDPQLDEKLVAYVLAGIAESRRHRNLSIATDKANPCASSLQNSVIVFPNNSGIICVPNVLCRTNLTFPSIAHVGGVDLLNRFPAGVGVEVPVAATHWTGGYGYFLVSQIAFSIHIHRWPLGSPLGIVGPPGSRFRRSRGGGKGFV